MLNYYPYRQACSHTHARTHKRTNAHTYTQSPTYIICQLSATRAPRRPTRERAVSARRLSGVPAKFLCWNAIGGSTSADNLKLAPPGVGNAHGAQQLCVTQAKCRLLGYRSSECSSVAIVHYGIVLSSRTGEMECVFVEFPFSTFMSRPWQIMPTWIWESIGTQKHEELCWKYRL